MAYTEFCCRSGGSNLNAGTLNGDSTEPGTSANYTYASGSWVASTGVFTVASGNPSSAGVAVGNFASVYANGSTVTGFVGRISAVTSTTITVSLTACAGTTPADGINTVTLKVGGAWGGSSGTTGFPFNFVTNALTDSNGDVCRVNFKNDQVYSITSGITNTSNTGPYVYQGYSSAYGDGGLANLDGGTTGTSYTLLAFSSNGGVNVTTSCFNFSNNGATGNANGVTYSGRGQLCFSRCVFQGMRGLGLSIAVLGCWAEECEACNNNLSNSANLGGFGAGSYVRCISHHNSGSNANGWVSAGQGLHIMNCIAWANGAAGAYGINVSNNGIRGNSCDFYANGSDGVKISGSSEICYLENCNLIANGGYGVNFAPTASSKIANLINCGFGTGSKANSSGNYNSTPYLLNRGEVDYASGLTPWNSPDTGDFRISLAAAKGAGIGSFLQTTGGYTGTAGYPDIGAAQHQDTGGGVSNVAYW